MARWGPRSRRHRPRCHRGGADVGDLGILIVEVSERVADGGLDLAESDAECLDRALQTFEQVDRHQGLQALLSAGHAEVAAGGAPLDGIHVDVLLHLAGEDVGQRGVDGEVEDLELLEDLVERRRLRQVRERLADRLGLQSAREGTDVSGVVERLDVLAGAGDGDGVKELEEVEVQHAQDRVRGALLGGELRPLLERDLGLTEDLLDRLADVKLGRELLRLALIGQLELVLQIVEPVVDRRGRQHEDLRLHATLDDLAHEPLVAALPVLR